MPEDSLGWLPLPPGASLCLVQYTRDLERELSWGAYYITVYGPSWVCCGRFRTDQDSACPVCGQKRPV